MTHPFISISDTGVSLLDEAPARPRPASPKPPKPTKSVTVAVHHNLTLELHGEGFSTSTKLTPGEALGLISMLSYLLRDQLEVEKGLR